MKKVIIFLLSITMAVCLFAGCKKKNNGDDNNKPTPEPTIETASFEKDRYVIDLYDSAELIVKSFEGKTVTYTSADESVATVDENGLAIALKAGETTVTAVSGGVKAECTVVVSETGYIPTIDLEQEVVSVDTVEPYTMAVTAKFNGKTIGEDIACSVTLADGADETIATATVNGKEITVQGLKAGETEFYVSANVRGKYLNKKFTVKVVNLGFSIKPNDDSIDVGLNGYETSVYTRTETGANVEKKLVFDVYDGRTLVDNAQVVWSSENTDVATVEQKDGEYYIVAQKGGVANIVGEYSDGENNASVKLAVNVEKVVKSEPLDIGVTPVIGKYNENTLTIPTDKLGGEFTQISYNGKVLSTGYTTAGSVVTVTLNDVNRNIIPDDSSLLGDGIVDVEDECYKYQLPVKLYTFIIKTEADLQSVKSIVDSAKGNGYYVLNNDVTLSGYWYNCDMNSTPKKDIVNYCIGVTNSFIGTFDGAGHVIKGLNLNNNWGDTSGGLGYGFIQTLGNGGTLKNVGFIDTTLKAKGSIVKTSDGGVIENVYVKYTARGMDQNTSATFCGMADNQYTEAYNVVTLRNVVVDFNGVVSATSSINASAILLGKFSPSSAIENVVVYGVDSALNNVIMATKASKNEARSTSIERIYVYNSDTCVALGTLPATSVWGDCWTVKEGSLPVFKSDASSYSVGASFASSAANIKAGESATFKAGKNCVIELSEEAKSLGITLVDGVVTVPAGVTAGTTFKVISRNLFDSDSYVEQTVLVLGEVLNREIDLSSLTVNLGATVSGNTVTATASDTEIDLTSVYAGSSANAVVTLNDSTVDTVTVTNGKFNLKASSILSAYGKTNVVITVIDLSSGLSYRITLKNILVKTKVITTVSELKTVATIAEALNGGGYFELGANIAFGANDYWYNNGTPNYSIGKAKDGTPFVGTFDGMGYTIDGFTTNANYAGIGFITTMGEGGVLRNVAFKNVTLNNQGTIVSYSLKGYALIENVYVEVTERKSTQAWKTGIIGINDDGQKLTLKNVVVEFNYKTEPTSDEGIVLVGNYADMSKLTNYVVLKVRDSWKDKVAFNGKNTDNNGNLYTGDAIYVTDTAGATVAGTFPASGWDETYWSVSGTTVTWKTK